MTRQRPWHLSLFIVSTLSTVAARAAEVDEFSANAKAPSLRSSTAGVERLMNEILSGEIAALNDKRAACEPNKLYQKLRKHFHHHVLGDFIKRLNAAPDVHYARTAFKDSVFQDFRTVEAYGFRSVFTGDPNIIFPVLSLDGLRVGTDKFEHFFDLGFRYYRAAFLKNQGVDAALKLGESTEFGFLGMITTGIYSYADLASNFQGMRFWNDLLGIYPDVLGVNIQPYVSCSDTRGWQQHKPIRLARYVDLAWSETFNCYGFRKSSLLEKVKARAISIGQNCRIDARHLAQLKKRYGRYHTHTLNPQGWHIKSKKVR